MKIILPDAELCEEHDETKYSSMGQTMTELRSFLCLDVGKIMEKNEKKIMEKNENWNESSILDDREEGNFPRTLCWLGPSEPKFYGK